MWLIIADWLVLKQSHWSIFNIVDHLIKFNYDGRDLRKRGMNRIGNLIVPNDNYCKFEEWLMPILDQMVKEQQNGTEWTPSKFINRLGKEINDQSVSFQCIISRVHLYLGRLSLGIPRYLEHILLVLEE